MSSRGDLYPVSEIEGIAEVAGLTSLRWQQPSQKKRTDNPEKPSTFRFF